MLKIWVYSVNSKNERIIEKIDHVTNVNKKLPVNPKLKFPLTSLLPPNMFDRSQVASAGATVVVAGAGAAVVGMVPDPSQAVGAAEKYN